MFEIIVKTNSNNVITLAKVDDRDEAEDLIIKALDFNNIVEAEVYDVDNNESLAVVTAG